MINDYLIRGITKDKHLRFFGVYALETLSTAIDFHYLSITNSVALGRLLISGLLMGATLKNQEDKLTLRIDGDGPLGTLLITTCGNNTIKGYVQNPQVELPMNEKGFAIAEGIGNGYLNVIKSFPDSPPYNSQTELITSEIGDDISHYYNLSEQIDTVLNLGLLINKDASVRQAGGFLIQCLPDTPLSVIEKLKANIDKFPNLSDFMDMGHSIDYILEKHIFASIPIEILDQKPVKYHCDCDRDKFFRGIMLLEKKEIQEMIEANEPIEAHCYFCNKKYKFDVDELRVVG